MRFTPDNFLQLVKNIVTGGLRQSSMSPMANDAGFFVDIEYPINSLILPATGVSMATAFTNGKALEWTHGSTQSVVVPFIIPRDYDQAFDWIDLTVVGAKAGSGSDTPSFTVQLFTLPIGAAATSSAINPNTTEYNVSIPTVTFTTSTAIAHFNFAGNGLQRKEICYFVITPSGNTSAGQEILLADATVTYASCLVAFQEDSLGNDPADESANDEIGFPLR